MQVQAGYNRWKRRWMDGDHNRSIHFRLVNESLHGRAAVHQLTLAPADND